MNWHSFDTELPLKEQKLIITDGDGTVAFAIWRGGLTNVMGLQGTLPAIRTFQYWISLEEMLNVIPA